MLKNKILYGTQLYNIYLLLVKDKIINNKIKTMIHISHKFYKPSDFFIWNPTII